MRLLILSAFAFVLLIGSDARAFQLRAPDLSPPAVQVDLFPDELAGDAGSGGDTLRLATGSVIHAVGVLGLVAFGIPAVWSLVGLIAGENTENITLGVFVICAPMTLLSGGVAWLGWRMMHSALDRQAQARPSERAEAVGSDEPRLMLSTPAWHF